PPACLNPGSPVVSAITTTGATVTFTGPTNASGYSVVYGPRGFVPSSTSTSTPVAAGTTVTLSGLNPNTSYDVYVQTTCGAAGTSTYTGPVTFRTACVAVVTAYPYLEDFDGATAPALPCGVTVLDVNADNATWKNVNNATYAASGTNAITYNYSGTNTANDWFFTNALQMRVGYSYQLQFKYRGYGSLTEAMEVKVGNAATVAAQTTTVFTNNSFNSSTYTTTSAGSGAGQVLLFTPTAAGTYYFGFHATSIPNQWYIYVDDVQVTEVVSPACPQPTALAVNNVTASGATVSFAGPTAGTSYSVIYGPRGFTPPTGGTSVPATASPVTLSGLAPNTNYDVYVQATCGTAGTSTITGPVAFTTACAVVTTFPYLETFDGVTAPALPCGITVLNANNDTGLWKNVSSTTYAASGTNAMTYNYSGSNKADDWFFTTALSLQAGATYQLQFKYRGYGSLTEAMEVKVGNAATAAGQTTTLFTNNSFSNATYTTTTAGTGAGQVASFTPTTSGIYYFGFHAISPANQWYIYVDDVRVDAVSLAACPTPTNVTLSGITATTATVSFTGPTALATRGYTVIYGPSGFDPTTSGTRVPATTSPVSLTGLTSLTSYDVYVVAACASSVNSFTSAKVSFTSACATTVSFPYAETFDGVTAPALPCGVTVLDANADGSTWVNSNYNPSSGVNSMRYSPSAVNAADDWFFTNALALKASMKYQLKFRYRVFTYNYPEKMEVKIGTSTTVASQTTTLFSNLAMINTAYTTTSPGALTGQVTSFTPPADGTYFIGFHAMSIANQFDIYVDDIQVDAAPVLATKSSVAAGFSAEASPVPFSDHLTLTLTTLMAGPLQLTLHDAVGRVVRETSATVPACANSLAVPGAGSLPAGMYILTVRQGGNTQVIRVAHE
ncbi:MAG: T9SS type A sorting domain-containing protein, partial [Cytophagaceae bacterium]